MTQAAPQLPPDAVSEIAEAGPQTGEQAHALVERVWRLFTSARLALSALALLGLGLLVGYLVNPAGEALPELERAHAAQPLVLWAFRSFELYDVSRSWWFSLLLALLVLGFVASSVERLPRIRALLKYPPLRLEDVQGLRLRSAEQKTQRTEAELRSALEKAGYTVIQTARDGGADLFAEKNRSARWGAWVIHLAILVGLLGGVVNRLAAFEGTVLVPANGGRASAMVIKGRDGNELTRNLGLVVQCDDFRLKDAAPGKPGASQSDLRLFSAEPGGENRVLAQKTIGAGDPLEYGGLTFEQATFQQLEQGSRAQIALVDKVTGREQEMKLAAGETLEAEGGLTFQLVDYQEDFAGMGPAAQVMRVEEPPGALVNKSAGPRRVPSAQAKLSSFWIFANKPDFDRDNRTDRFALKFGKLLPLYATGLRISHDPSAPLLYAGGALLVAGLILSLATTHKRIWARLHAGRIAIGGAAHRNQEAFSRELERICTALGVQIELKRPAPDGSTA